jgi:hypothetical protein
VMCAKNLTPSSDELDRSGFVKRDSGRLATWTAGRQGKKKIKDETYWTRTARAYERRVQANLLNGVNLDGCTERGVTYGVPLLLMD